MAKDFCTSLTRPAGCSAAGNIGRRSSPIWPMMADAVAPSKARCPVSISKITAPSEKMSERASDRPSSCSGAMYGSVPARASPSAVTVTAVRSLAWRSRAMPKSSSFEPDWVNRMFAGFTS